MILSFPGKRGITVISPDHTLCAGAAFRDLLPNHIGQVFEIAHNGRLDRQLGNPDMNGTKGVYHINAVDIRWHRSTFYPCAGILLTHAQPCEPLPALRLQGFSLGQSIVGPWVNFRLAATSSCRRLLVMAIRRIGLVTCRSAHLINFWSVPTSQRHKAEFLLFDTRRFREVCQVG
jgi:hypothetical protein